MNIILIHIGNSKVDYLLNTVRHLIHFNNKRLFLLANKKMIKRFKNKKISKKINLIDIQKFSLSKQHQNFLNNITNTNNYCSTITCPENYISEQSGFARCNSSPCDVSLEGTDIDICCTRLCNSNSDCDNNKVCVTENNIQVCIDGCNSNNDCNDELKCLDNDNGIFYCQSEENRFMSLLNRLYLL